MDEKKARRVIVLCIFIALIIVLISLFYVINVMKKNETEEHYIEYLKNYEANEFIPVYITDNDIAVLYLSDYKNLLINNQYDAYQLLDDECKKEYFPTFNSFKDYIQTINIYDIKMTKFYKENNMGFISYGVYDQYDNLFVFNVEGVMQYKVFLNNDN